MLAQIILFDAIQFHCRRDDISIYPGASTVIPWWLVSA